MVEVTMPPTIGAAIGFITSEPMPVSQRIGHETGKNGSDGHQFWTQTLYGSFDGRCLDVFVLERECR